MNDLLLMQVAMEATAMPPPASSASEKNTKLSDDTSFDKKLEKAMNDQPDEEVMALATEAVSTPMQTPEIQPRFDKEVEQVLDTDTNSQTLAQKLYAMLQGQMHQAQAALASIINPDPGAGETTQIYQPVLTEALVNAKVQLQHTSDMPVIVNPQKMQALADDAHPAEPELPPSRSGDGEQPAKPLPSELLAALKTGDGKSQNLIKGTGSINHQREADTTDTLGKITTEAENADMKINIAKLANSSRQAVQAADSQAPVDASKSPVVNDQAATLQVPVSESRKVKVSLDKVEGESPGQVPIGNRAVQPLDAQVKEPARLAEARTPEMINQIAKGIEMLHRSDGQSLRIQLQPENLGKIEIRLTSRADGVTVTLNADTAMTSNLLERNLAELKTSLADAGINLASLTVNSGQKQSTYQESKEWFSSKGSQKNYSSETNTIEDLPAIESAWKDSAIDYRI